SLYKALCHSIYALSNELDEFSCSRLSVRCVTEGRHTLRGSALRTAKRLQVKTKQPPRGFARRLNLHPGVADFSDSAPRQQCYRFSTSRGAGLTISSWALTFWIWAACSLSWAVRVSICFCCCATVVCNCSTLSPSMAWRWSAFWIGAGRSRS